MRFKLDENLPGEAVGLLSEAGHDVTSVLAQNLGGDRDPVIAAACAEEHRILITLDTDFANIRAYPPRESPGPRDWPDKAGCGSTRPPRYRLCACSKVPSEKA